MKMMKNKKADIGKSVGIAILFLLIVAASVLSIYFIFKKLI